MSDGSGGPRWSRTVDLRDVIAGGGAVMVVVGGALIHAGLALMVAGAAAIGLAVYFARR